MLVFTEEHKLRRYGRYFGLGPGRLAELKRQGVL